MDKLIVVVFRDEKSVYEGVSALHALDDEASIVLNRLAVIKKADDGTIVTERVDDDFPPPSGTLAGTALGGLVGILGGPIGVAVGEQRLEQQRTRSKQASEEMLARVQALQRRAEKEQGEVKSAIEARISRLRGEYQRRQQA